MAVTANNLVISFHTWRDSQPLSDILVENTQKIIIKIIHKLICLCYERCKFHETVQTVPQRSYFGRFKLLVAELVEKVVEIGYKLRR